MTARVAEIFNAHGLPVAAHALLAAEPPAKRLMDESATREGSADAPRMLDFFGTVLDTASVPRGPGWDAAMADVDRYHATHNIWERLPEHVRPALQALKRTGVKLVVASNANGVLHRCFERIGIASYFDLIGDSFLEGVEPDPRFFRQLLDKAAATRTPPWTSAPLSRRRRRRTTRGPPRASTGRAPSVRRRRSRLHPPPRGARRLPHGSRSSSVTMDRSAASTRRLTP